MKRLLTFSIALIVLLLIGIALLITFINPNDYKAEIEAQVKQSLNRDLHIKGDLDWALYPQLGFSSGQIALDNLARFDKPHLIKIDKASLGINILPLLKGEISLAKLSIDGLVLTLLTDKQGHSNLDDMGGEQASTPVNDAPAEQNNEGGSDFDISKTQLEGIEINNTTIEIEDLQLGSSQTIHINAITLGKFAFNQATELNINTDLNIDDLQAQVTLATQLLVDDALSNIALQGFSLEAQVTTDALPNGGLTSQLNGDINYALNDQRVTIQDLQFDAVLRGDNLPNQQVTSQLAAQVSYQVDSQLATINDLTLLLDKLQLQGQASVQTGDVTKVRYALVGNEWDLNPYLTSSEADTTATPSGSDSENDAEAEPDLSFLNTLDIDGTLQIAGLLIEQIKIGEINKHLLIKKGKAQLAPLSAQLYEGALTVNASVDANNRYQLNSKLNDVQILPLLKDAAQLEIISGTSHFNFSGAGQGLSATKITQGIAGKGDFAITDGELYGVNINQEIRGIKAKLKGESAPTSDSVKKTDFASLTGNFSIAKGQVNNHKLFMGSPVMRLDGSGLIDIVAHSLDYKLAISPLSKTTEDTNYTDLNGITIPLQISGAFSDPRFSIDSESVLKAQLQAELDEQKDKLKQKAQDAVQEQVEKIGGETLKNTFKSLF